MRIGQPRGNGGGYTDLMRGLKHRLDSIRLTADGVVPLDLWCLSSREARLGPVGAAYTRSGIVAAMDGSLKKSGAMEAAYVVEDNAFRHAVWLSLASRRQSDQN